MKFRGSLADIKPQSVHHLSNDEFRALSEQILFLQQNDRKENQLIYYRPVSETAERVHKSRAKYVAVGGGNGSGKTEHCLAHIAMMATGIIPDHLSYLKERFRGPINCRIVVESLTTTLHPIILPKLQWWKWTGTGEVGSSQGHWGWIPKLSLRDASWERSWSEKLRMLNVICRDPNDFNKVLGMSSVQFMSQDQDPSDFASGDFHIILHDEPPSHAIWTENEARTMRVAGQMFLAMTWKEDPAIPVDWIFDGPYEKGRPGPNKSEDYEWIEIFTTDNQHLNQESVEQQMRNWSHEMIQVRIYGQPIRFANRIHPLYTDVMQVWCFNCGMPIRPRDNQCPQCQGNEIWEYLHFKDFEVSTAWPTVFVLDPHPRKPHMFLWAQIDPSDDIWVVAEGECLGDPGEVKRDVEEIEESLSLHVTHRLMDPNMGRSPSGAKRTMVWEDEFGEAGLPCMLADDSDVGRSRINEYLKPDPFRYQPRLHVHERCSTLNSQMKRYVWDEHKARLEKDLKQKPRAKYDDYPTMLRYLLNSEPTFTGLYDAPSIITRPGKRRRGY